MEKRPYSNPFVQQKRDGIQGVRRLIESMQPIKQKTLSAMCEINGIGEKTAKRYIKILLDAGLAKCENGFITLQKQDDK